MTKEQMLKSLAKYSSNELIAGRSRMALEGNEVDSGSFFDAVLQGDYRLALMRADASNREALYRGKTLLKNGFKL